MLLILVPSVFSVAVQDDNLPMNTVKVLKGFNKPLLPLLTRIWTEIVHRVNFTLLIDESTDIATDHILACAMY